MRWPWSVPNEEAMRTEERVLTSERNRQELRAIAREFTSLVNSLEKQTTKKGVRNGRH